MWPRAAPAGPTRRAWRTRGVCLALTLAGLFVVLPALTLHMRTGLPVAAAQTAAPIKADVQQGLLTVDIRDVPLAEVLRLIGEQAGLRVVIQGDASTPVSATFTGVPLDQGIKRLAREHSFVLLYAPARGGTQGPILAEVRLYGASDREPARGGPTPSPLASRGGPGDPASRASAADRTTPTAQGPIGVEPREPPPAVGSREWVAQVLTAPEPSARLQALNVPVQPGDETIAATLAQVLEQDADAKVRAKAVRMLGQVQGPQAVDELAQALEDPDRTVRLHAIQVYAGVQSPEPAAQDLSAVLAQDPDPFVRRQAAVTLGRLRSEEARRALVTATSDPNPMVQQAATAALGNWEKRGAVSKQ